jgi:hypothetical protein
MIRRTALLSALTLGLLLGACSSKNKDAADGGENVEAQAASEAKAQAEAPAEAAPPPKMDYWKVIGPLVAGSYSGNCMRMPDARNMNATITVGADGKTSAAGLDLDFRMAKKAMLMRTRGDSGQYSAMALLTIDDSKGGMLSLQAGQGGKEGSASFGRDDIGLMCSNIGGGNKLNAQPLYAALSKLLNVKKQTISCLDTTNLLVRRDVDVEVADGVVKVGDASFDIKAASSESFTFDDAGGSLALALAMPEDRTISVMYDGAGKLVHVAGFDKQGSTYACSAKD